jgi:hypothetical protein
MNTSREVKGARGGDNTTAHPGFTAWTQSDLGHESDETLRKCLDITTALGSKKSGHTRKGGNHLLPSTGSSSGRAIEQLMQEMNKINWFLCDHIYVLQDIFHMVYTIIQHRYVAYTLLQGLGFRCVHRFKYGFSVIQQDWNGVTIAYGWDYFKMRWSKTQTRQREEELLAAR